VATVTVGDIHGNLTALTDLLGKIQGGIDVQDTVVFVGDYIDRGLRSKECIDAILRFREETPGRVVCLRGNHEDWMLRSLRDSRCHSWLLGMEAFDTIWSYSPQAAETLKAAASEAGAELYLDKQSLPYEAFFNAMPTRHLEFFESLDVYCRTPDCLCSHGGVDCALIDYGQSTPHAFIWGANGFPDAYQGNEVIVYGHHDNADLDQLGWPHPKKLGNTIGVDTISHGVLTAVRLPGMDAFQSALVESRTA
jgi:diadenosine tetraphosphatase ApaH/serine/threonine PP2A family protein phosphatase